MIVNVKAVDGRHFVLEVQSEDTVAQLKRAIYAKGGPDPARQRIIFCGNVCGNDMTIAETGVMAESEFHLAIINSALTIDELNDKNKALERQLDALAAQLKVQQHDFETKQAEKQQRQTLFQQELDRAQQALKATQRELDDSFTQMAMQRAESADEIEKLRKAAGDATDEVASLRKLIEMLERDTTALQTRFSASVGEIAALKESLRQEKEQAAQSQALVRDSRAEISELKASMQQAEAKAFSQGRDTGVADAMLEAEVDKESLVEELARAKAEMRHMRKQMVAAVDRQRVADRRTDQVLAAAKCAELEARRNSAETEERAAAEAAKTATAQADAQVAQDARHKAEAKCQQLQSQLAAMEARLSEAETRVAAAEKTAAATATKAPLDVDITNVELQGELAAVHQALLRYHVKESAARQALEARAQDADARLQQATEHEKQARASAETAQEEMNLLKARSNSLESALNTVYGSLGSILPAAHFAEADTASEDDAQVSLETAGESATDSTPTLQEELLQHSQAADERQAEDVAAEDAAAASETCGRRGVGGFVKFLTYPQRIVEVVGERRRTWRLANGRIAKKRMEGRRWAWYNGPSVSISCVEPQQAKSEVNTFVKLCVDMGFEASHAQRAFHAQGGNTDKAMEALLS